MIDDRARQAVMLNQNERVAHGRGYGRNGSRATRLTCLLSRQNGHGHKGARCDVTSLESIAALMRRDLARQFLDPLGAFLVPIAALVAHEFGL
jgi:hypothetical protein